MQQKDQYTVRFMENIHFIVLQKKIKIIGF